jgi:large subunit ribosomal protein L5e
MDSLYKGVEAADGEFFDLYEKNLIKKERRPFKAFLDVGLVRTTTGNRVFGAMKGAVDGGIFVPHNTKRFPGYHIEKAAATAGKRGKATAEKAAKTYVYNAKEHRDHIYGIHVQNYMELLKKTNKDKYTKQFKGWETSMTKSKTTNLETLYKKVHAEIRKDSKRPVAAKKAAPSRKIISKENGQRIMQNSKGKKWLRQFKLTNAQRKARVAVRIQKALAKK